MWFGSECIKLIQEKSRARLEIVKNPREETITNHNNLKTVANFNNIKKKVTNIYIQDLLNIKTTIIQQLTPFLHVTRPRKNKIMMK